MTQNNHWWHKRKKRLEAAAKSSAPTYPHQIAKPLYTSYSAPLTAADGTPEPALPATPAE